MWRQTFDLGEGCENTEVVWACEETAGRWSIVRCYRDGTTWDKTQRKTEEDVGEVY